MRPHLPVLVGTLLLCAPAGAAPQAVPEFHDDAAEEHSPATRGEAWDGPNNVRRSDTPAGTTGVLEVSSADLGRPHVLRFSFFGEVSKASDFPVLGARDTRTAGTFSVSYVPVDLLEVYGAYGAVSNHNTLGNPPSVGSTGDLTLGAKLAWRFGHGLYGALDVRGTRLASTFSGDVKDDVFGFSPNLVGTYDFRALTPKLPVRLHANFGFIVDGAKNRSPQRLEATEDFALRANAYNRVAGGAALELPLPYVSPFAEYRVELPLAVPNNTLSGPDGRPVTVAEAYAGTFDLGLKVTAVRDFTLTAAVAFARTRNVGLGIPAVPPANFFLGFSYALDPFGRTETRYVALEMPAPEHVPTPPAARTGGNIQGVVTEAGTGKPLANAVVLVGGTQLPPVATDGASGKFLTQDLPPGTYPLTVSHEGFKDVSQQVKVVAGVTSTQAVALERDVKHARFLLSVTSDKHPVPATVQLRGTQEKALTLGGDAAGPLSVEVPGGKYTADCNAPGYLAQTREVQVSEGAEMALVFELQPEPKKRWVIVHENKIQILHQVHFALGKATILADSFPLLAQVVDAIVKNNLPRVRIEGHTDNKGSKKANLRLSEDRAQAVADYFVAQGIERGRLEVQGYGDARPIAPNLTARGRELNRRVEFLILGKEGDKAQ